MQLRLLPLVACTAATLLLTLAAWAQAAGPAIFWASDPVRPGEAVMVVGEGFGDKASVEVARLDDGPSAEPGPRPAWPQASQPVKPLQPTDQSLKFVLPAESKPGVFTFRITTPGGAVVGLLNRPRVWWAQGDQGVAASPGGWIRLFGRSLALEGVKSAAPTTIRLQGPNVGHVSNVPTEPRHVGNVPHNVVSLMANADAYAAKAALPADLPPGDYRVWLHNGAGAAAGWSEDLAIRVAKPAPWPQTVFNVKDSGAQGDGVKDDTEAVLAALDKAGKAGGGVVLFPRGRYRLSDGLAVPRMTVLRGESRETVALCWTDMPDPPEALVRGTNSFGLEGLTLYACNHRHVIAGDLGDQPEAGDVFLRRVRVRADIYRGHPKPEEVDARFRQALKSSTGGGDTVRLGGRNVEIVDCDLYGSGRALFLSRVRGGLVSGNRFYNGRWGWYCISGSDGLVFEDNAITGADLMSTGGGLNCLDGSSYSQNVYYARNRLSLMHGWDREAMTSDAGGEVYFGRIAAADGRKLTLPEEPKARSREWNGAGVFILAGHGAGQYRRVVGHQGSTVELDAPWVVPPDAESQVGITMFQGHYLLVGNEFTDTGAMQFYGTSIECVVASNRGARMSGFRDLGLWYHGYQPSWFCQLVDNEITEGNYYHWNSGTAAVLEVYGAKRPPFEGPLNRGAVVRRNRLLNDAHVRVAGAVRDAIIEGNRVENAEQGIFVSRQAEGVLVRNNQFAGVTHEVVDEEAIRRAAEERLNRYLGRKEPVAAWSFEDLARNRFADGSGNGFSAKIQGGVTREAGGVKGQAARFDGTGYLVVEEPAVFNAPDVTVALWVKPDVLRGRRGLIVKRLAGTAAPFVLSQNGEGLSFEATEENGPWTFNFQSPPALAKDTWTHVAAVAKQGTGVTIYVDGKVAAVKENAAHRATNMEPLVLGREAWGGDPPKTDDPGFFIGLIDEAKVWTRALSAEEVLAEVQAVKK